MIYKGIGVFIALTLLSVSSPVLALRRRKSFTANRLLSRGPNMAVSGN
jgi:hypothetical protein